MKELISKVERRFIDRNLHSLNGKDNYIVESSSDIRFMTDIQEKMMLTDDEWEYGVLKKELFDKFGASRVCARCKNQVLCSDLPNYNYLCLECNENLYTFETEEVAE